MAGEAYVPPSGALPQLGSAWLFLPGSGRQQLVQFSTVEGKAVIEGDIMLGPATTLPFRYGIPWASTLERKGAVAVSSRTYLWPDGEIPYVIDASAEGKRSAIEWAARAFASTPLRVRPRTSADPDYVVFRQLGEGCWSYIGRQGGPQDIDVTSCGPGNVAHELMHAAGFYHEQSRGDRDDYVTIVWDEVAPEWRSNFDKRDARGQDIGDYDYGSIMHYSAYAGSRTGKPTIVPRVANAHIGQRDGLSPLDRAAIETLYGSASTPVATSVPPAPPSPPAPPPPTPSTPTPTAPPPTTATTTPSTPAPATTPAPPATTTLPLPFPIPIPIALPLPTASAPASTPAPSATPSTPPSSTPPQSGSAGATTYTGTYSSTRGTVSCNQGGAFVQCTYPGGSLFCAASGLELACTWSGGGQGRATFQRQTNGVLAGTWGDGFSTTGRGRWDLTPVAAGSAVAPSATQASPAGAPPTTPTASTPAPSAPAPSASAVSLSGNYASTRGNMACNESGGSVSCSFQETDGVNGRLDCAKNAAGNELSCAWMTFMPRPATGRATFVRPSPSERRLKGTWGLLFANTGGGSWDAEGR